MTPAIIRKNIFYTAQQTKRSLESLKTRRVDSLLLSGLASGLKCIPQSLRMGKRKKTGKGIKKSVLKKEVRHQDFKDCLMEKREFQHSMVNFRSHQHQLHTIKQTKKSHSPFDDKRYILEDGFTTRAHGHYQNGITRPSQTSTEEEPSQEGLANSMKALSLASTNNTSLSKADIVMESHGSLV